MPGPSFFETPMGRRFYGVSVPGMISAMEELTKALRETKCRKEYVRTILNPEENAESEIGFELKCGSRVEKMQMISNDLLLVVFSKEGESA